jgi:hypothetical protein
VKLRAFMALVAAVLAAAAITITPAAAPAAPPALGVPINITLGQSGNILQGVATVTGVAVQNGQLVAEGTYTGLVNGVQQTAIPFTSSIDLAQAEASCEILDLVLGPLHLDLLGLVVDLDQVHLNITAVPGPGNLLGNLLCAVAGLLDNNGPLQGVTGLVNNLLRHQPA